MVLEKLLLPPRATPIITQAKGSSAAPPMPKVTRRKAVAIHTEVSSTVFRRPM